MSKRFSISQKFQAGLAMAVVFLLVLATNRLDHRHFSTVQNTVNSIFEDRVVAQDYIYKLNNLFHEKRFLIHTSDSVSDAIKENTKIDELLVSFSETKLTPNESRYFKSLQNNVLTLQSIEKSMISDTSGLTEKFRLKMDKALDDIMIDMNNLAHTQRSEGKILTDFARNSLGNNNMVSNLEIVFLIIIGVLIQIIIFYPNKSKEKVPKF